MAISIENGQSNSDGAAAGTLTVTAPTSMADGDILVAFWVKDGISDFTPSAVGTWVEVDMQTSASVPQITTGIWYKIITDAAGEPSDYTWTWSGTESVCGVIQNVRGVDTTTPEDVGNSFADLINDDTPSAPSVSTVTDNAEVFCFLGIDRNTSPNTHPSGSSELFDFDGGAGGDACSINIAHFTQVSFGATGAQEWTGIGTGRESHARLWAMRPDLAAPAPRRIFVVS